HIGKRQYRNRRFVGQWRTGAGLWHCRSGRRYHAIGSNPPRDVFELLLADVFEDEVELARGILLHPRRNADPARLGQGFETCRDIDPVAKDVSVLDDDVAHVDADAELDATVGRNTRIAFG